MPSPQYYCSAEAPFLPRNEVDIWRSQVAGGLRMKRRKEAARGLGPFHTAHILIVFRFQMC